jgi:hypothetical protein
MKKRFTALFVPLLLGGCGAGEIASTGAGLAGLFLSARPIAASSTTIDERLLIGANSLAETTFLAGTMAFQTGALPRSQDADTARENFCDMVTAEPSLAVITDEGGSALALRCRIEHHLDMAGLARKSNNAVAYAENLAKAGAYNATLTRMISTAVLRGSSK